MNLTRFCFLLIVAALVGCAGRGTSTERRDNAANIVSAAKWHPVPIGVDGFDLMAYVPDRPNKEPLVTVYIEGDGAAWANRYMPSKDPTPKDPVALKLALAQPSGYAVYLGRPCQYVKRKSAGCDVRYWTDERFSEPVVLATSKAIDVLKNQTQARQIRLVGFSGGGAIATLIAAKRNDVVQLVTVSGNLNITQWTIVHELTPLEGLDPISVTGQLQRLPQVHFVGKEDTNTTPQLVESFVNQIPKPNNAKVIVKNGNGHTCCWAEKWPTLWQQQISN